MLFDLPALELEEALHGVLVDVQQMPHCPVITHIELNFKDNRRIQSIGLGVMKRRCPVGFVVQGLVDCTLTPVRDFG